MTDTIGITVAVVCTLLGWFVWISKPATNGRMRLVEVWYYDALGCRIDCGLFVKWDDEPISVLDAAVGERVRRNSKYHWAVMYVD